MLLPTSALLFLTLTTAIPLHPRQQSCNGHPEFCTRPYSNLTTIGAHDSAFVGPIADPRVDQELDISQQLTSGIRFFEAQTHLLDGTLSMCHTTCIELYAGSLATYLGSIKTFLDGNPDEVVSLLLSNGDNANVTLFDAVFEATGLKNYTFVPATSPRQLPIGDWPTLGSMIGAETRLVVYMDYQANESLVPYILDQYTYFFATPYDTTDPTFPECTLDAPANSSPEGKMYIVNHFLDTNLLNTGILIPDNLADARTNAATGNGSIGAQAELCEGIYGRRPNFILVDMFDRGDVFRAQDELNGVC